MWNVRALPVLKEADFRAAAAREGSTIEVLCIKAPTSETRFAGDWAFYVVLADGERVMLIGSDWIVGVVGGLQFDVFVDRIRTEYDLPVIFEGTSFERARWVEADDDKLVKKFADSNRDNTAEDHSGATVFLARNDWQLNRVKVDWPEIRLLSTREQQR